MTSETSTPQRSERAVQDRPLLRRASRWWSDLARTLLVILVALVVGYVVLYAVLWLIERALYWLWSLHVDG